MVNDQHISAVTEFYETHPINVQQIIDKLQGDGFILDEVTEDILQNYDQDHYGGVAANDSLAALAGIGTDTHVLDVCCGLGGPSRYMAHNYGCRVTGIDLTEARVEGAKKLTGFVGLSGLVNFLQANALALPFDDNSFDVLISQEAFCHVSDKNQLISECARVLKPGGRMAFTDILAADEVSDAVRNQLQREMTFLELASSSHYRQQFEHQGCVVVEDQDLSKEWEILLKDRLAMFRSLEDQTVESFGQAHFEKWDNAYSFFVGLYTTGELGGARFLVRKEV